jgi:Tol biopolymer transport system component
MVIRGNYSLFDHLPIISANGSKIVFADSDDGTNKARHLYTINSDGTGLRKLFNGPFNGTDFTISLDGSKVAFDGVDYNDNRVVNTVRSDGSGYTVVAGAPFFSPSFPMLSADVSKMVFFDTAWGREDPLGNTYSVPALSIDDRTRLITNNTLAYWKTTIFPDGSKVLYLADTSGTDGVNEKDQIFVSTIDGSKTIPLVDNSYFKHDPMCKVLEAQEGLQSMPHFSNNPYNNFQEAIQQAIGGSTNQIILMIGSVGAVLVAALLYVRRRGAKGRSS